VDNNDLRTLITFVNEFCRSLCFVHHDRAGAASAPAGTEQGRPGVGAVYLVIYALMYFSARRLGKLSAADSSVLSLTLAFPNRRRHRYPASPRGYGNGASVSVSIAIAVGAVTISQ